MGGRFNHKKNSEGELRAGKNRRSEAMRRSNVWGDKQFKGPSKRAPLRVRRRKDENWGGDGRLLGRGKVREKENPGDSDVSMSAMLVKRG